MEAKQNHVIRETTSVDLKMLVPQYLSAYFENRNNIKRVFSGRCKTVFPVHLN